MKILGLKKTTLLDYPGKVACIIFTAGCNLRCPFCHNASLVNISDNSSFIDEKEVIDFLKKRRNILDGVCISGGEPLLHKDILEYIAQIKALGYAVKLDTNGCFPEQLKALVDRNLLDYIAMDIKNIPSLYGETAGIKNFDIAPIKESISIVMGSPVSYEFRTTLIKGLHSPDAFDEIGKLVKGAPLYYLQTFRDSGDLLGDGMAPLSEAETLECRERLQQWVGTVIIR